MGACQRRRRNSDRANRTRLPREIHQGLAWARFPARLIGCGLAAIALGVLPATALSTTTARVSASFSGHTLGAGTSMHFGFTTSDSAGGLPQLPTDATIHLPPGTHIASLAHLPKSDVCSSNILEAVGYGPSACPKGSHAGPVGFAHLEAPVGGHLKIVKVPVYPVIDKVGLFSLLMLAPAPFPSDNASLFPYSPGGSPELLLGELGALEVSPGVRSSMLDYSITLGANLKVQQGGRNVVQPLITMPKSCPRGGFVWRTDFSYWEGSSTTALATSPCPGKGKAAAITAQTASAPKTAFQCEKRFMQVQSRQRCFSQLPGANCAHPLEAQKAGNTTRGEHRYFKITFRQERAGEGSLQTYTYAPVKNVAICPHGVVFKVSMLGRGHCERTHGEEICGDEYGIKDITEPTTRAGGKFKESLPPSMSGYLTVKGYFIHPPWARRR
jgi:hypothetical protein